MVHRAGSCRAFSLLLFAPHKTLPSHANKLVVLTSVVIGGVCTVAGYWAC